MPVEADAGAAAAAAAAAAIAAQRRHIVYPDYRTEDDFSLWLSGYVARIQSAYGFKLDEEEKLKEEVVLSIAGKLSVGSALDAYNRLSDVDKSSYDTLIARLTEEFTDPRAKKKFNALMHYNLRKKGQSLKDFMQDIKKDMGRYSYVQPTVLDEAGEIVPNPERETQGVRRFIEGICNEKGQSDEEFKHHLEYHLQDVNEMTWDNAIKVASRYETINNMSDEESDSDADDTDADGDEKAAKPSKGKKSVRSKVTVSALSDQVCENEERISSIESALERMAAAQEQLAVAQEATNAMMEEMMGKLDHCLSMAQGGFYSY